MDDLVSWLLRRGGAARQHELLRQGASARQLNAALALGLIHRPARGVYCVPGTDPLAVHLATHCAVPACISAARSRGLWTASSPGLPHVSTAHGRPVPGCVVHRHTGPLTLPDIIRQCVACLPEVEALVVVESAIVLRRISLPTLQEMFAQRNRAAGRRILAQVDPQSMSAIETEARFLLRNAGHNVQSQFAVRGAGHLDLWVDGVLGVELESDDYHNNAQAFGEDLRRGNALVIRGVPTLRIRGRVVRRNPQLMLDLVDDALRTVRSAQRWS